MPLRIPAQPHPSPCGVAALRTLLAGALALLLPPLLLAAAPPGRAGALPFDPLPSAFQHWLNARPTPSGQPPQRFSRLGRCRDTSSGGSPYRSPGYICRSGELTLGSGRAQRVCRLQEVSFNLRTSKVRQRQVDCRPVTSALR
ncbi:MAG: hypothetical protein VKI83_01615 [Synechococcaceae cyanobacterium]|nr:hypothetical protein [Synechococcaceae cyanobacterium]